MSQAMTGSGGTAPDRDGGQGQPGRVQSRDEVNLDNVTEMAKAKLAALGKPVRNKKKLDLSGLGFDDPVDSIEPSNPQGRRMSRSAMPTALPQGVQGVSSSKSKATRKTNIASDQKIDAFIKQKLSGGPVQTKFKQFKEPAKSGKNLSGAYKRPAKNFNATSTSINYGRKGLDVQKGKAYPKSISKQKAESFLTISDLWQGGDRKELMSQSANPKEPQGKGSGIKTKTSAPPSEQQQQSVGQGSGLYGAFRSGPASPSSAAKHQRALRTSKSSKVSDRLFNNASSKLAALQKSKSRIARVDAMEEGRIEKGVNPQRNVVGESPSQVNDPKKLSKQPNYQSTKSQPSSKKVFGKGAAESPMSRNRPQTGLTNKFQKSSMYQGTESRSGLASTQKSKHSNSVSRIKTANTLASYATSQQQTTLKNQVGLNPESENPTGKKQDAYGKSKVPSPLKQTTGGKPQKASQVSPGGRRASVNPFLFGLDESSPPKARISGSDDIGQQNENNYINKTNSKGSAKELEEDGNADQEYLGKYRKFKGQFDKVIHYNSFNSEQLPKTDFIKILVDLGFVYEEDLSPPQLQELTWGMPKVKLLWEILTKNQDTTVWKVSKDDIFTILAAILDCQVPDMIAEDEPVSATKNPLFYRDQQDKIMFLSCGDLKKFSVKFKTLKETFDAYQWIRLQNIEKLKKTFQQQESSDIQVQNEHNQSNSNSAAKQKQSKNVSDQNERQTSKQAQKQAGKKTEQKPIQTNLDKQKHTKANTGPQGPDAADGGKRKPDRIKSKETRGAAKKSKANDEHQSQLEEQRRVNEKEAEAKEMLEDVYRKSMKQYNQEARKLERRGSIDHVKANLEYRKSLKNSNDIQEEELAQYEEEIINNLTEANRNSLFYGGEDAQQLTAQLKRDVASTGADQQDQQAKQSTNKYKEMFATKTNQNANSSSQAPRAQGQGQGQGQQKMQTKQEQPAPKNTKNISPNKPQQLKEQNAATRSMKTTQKSKVTAGSKQVSSPQKQQTPAAKASKALAVPTDASRAKHAANPSRGAHFQNDDQEPSPRMSALQKKQMKQPGAKGAAASTHANKDCITCEVDEMSKTTGKGSKLSLKAKPKAATSEVQNQKAKEKTNQVFTEVVKTKAQDAEYESSDGSSEAEVSVAGHTPASGGSGRRSSTPAQLITMNVDIGGDRRENFKMLQGKSNESAEDITERFCKQHKVYARSMKQQILKLVAARLVEFNSYSIEYKKPRPDEQQDEPESPQFDLPLRKEAEQTEKGATTGKAKALWATAATRASIVGDVRVVVELLHLEEHDLFKEANKIVLGNHHLNHLDYVALHTDKLLEGFDTSRGVHSLPDAIIDGKECRYRGQVDPETRAPDGLGMAVDEDGNLYEGMFKNGELSIPHSKATRDGTAVTLTTPEGGTYDIYHAKEAQYSEHFDILQFKKAFRHKSGGFSEKWFEQTDKTSFRKEVNYRRYLKMDKEQEAGKWVRPKATLDDLLKAYSLDEKSPLGSGAFGKVYLATNRADDSSKLAVKMMNTSGYTEDDLAMLENEIKIMQEVDHPNIVKYYATYYDDEDNVYLCMELCPRGDFFQAVVGKGIHLSEEEAACEFANVLRAVVHCHSAGIMHRDIKPDNMMIGDEKVVKLVDFGFAVVSKQKGDQHDLKGTPYYMAPEVLRGDFQGYGKECDVWSLGVVLYELLTGKVPFDDASGEGDIEKVWAAIDRGRFDIPRELSRRCVDLIQRMICVDPEQRITAKEALDHPWIAEHLAKARKNRRSLVSLSGTQVIAALDCHLIEHLREFRGKSVLKRAALHILAKGLKPSQVKDQERAFQRLDTDLSGFLESNELKEALRSRVHALVPDEEIDQIIHQLDYNQNGKINFTDFIAATIDVGKQLTPAKLEAIFKTFDVNDTGIITPPGIRDAFRKFGREISQAELIEMFKEHDTDGDPGLSREEFKQMMLDGENEQYHQVLAEREKQNPHHHDTSQRIE